MAVSGSTTLPLTGSTTPETPNANVQRDSSGLIRDIDPSYTVNWWDDFDSATAAGTTGWGDQSNSGGEAKINSALDSGHIGIVRLDTGTTTTGVGNIFKDISMVMGGATLDFEALVQLNALSTVSDRYKIEVGMCNAFAIDPFNGLWFSYTDTVNSGNWTANTGNGSVTSQSTGVAVVAGSWVKLRVVGAADGTKADFYINGLKVATISSTLPTGLGTTFGFAIRITKSLGTTQRNLYVDYTKFLAIFTNPR